MEQIRMADLQTMTVEIVTPERRVFSGAADLVVVPGLEGEFGIMKGHAAILAALGPGEIKVVNDNTPVYYATQGGFAEVLCNRVTLAVETAEPAASLDYAAITQEYDAAVTAFEQAAEPSARLLAERTVKRLSARLKVAQRVNKPGR